MTSLDLNLNSTIHSGIASLNRNEQDAVSKVKVELNTPKIDLHKMPLSITQKFKNDKLIFGSAKSIPESI